MKLLIAIIIFISLANVHHSINISQCNVFCRGRYADMIRLIICCETIPGPKGLVHRRGFCTNRGQAICDVPVARGTHSEIKYPPPVSVHHF